MQITNGPRGIGAFLLIAFGGAWIIWTIAWLLHALDTGPSGQIVVAAGAVAPAVATLVVRRWITHESFHDIGLHLSLHDHWPYYLVSWLMPLPVVGMIVVLAALVKVPLVHPALPPRLVLSTMLGALVSGPVFLGEELGWRGYLQLRLFPGRPLLAAATTGLIWGVFHYPVILAGFEGYENVFLGLVIFPVFTILMSIILGWLRSRTGSLWPACLAHAASNTIGGALTAYLFLGGGSFFLASYAGVLGWLPLAMICVWIVGTGQDRRVHRAASVSHQ